MKFKFLRLLLVGACASSFLAPTSSQGMRFEQSTDPETTAHPIPHGAPMTFSLMGEEQDIAGHGHTFPEYPRVSGQFDWNPTDGHVIVEIGNDAFQAWMQQVQDWGLQEGDREIRGVRLRVSSRGETQETDGTVTTVYWQGSRFFQLDHELPALMQNNTPVLLNYVEIRVP